MDETTTAFEGYCEMHRSDEPCDNCAAEERALDYLRQKAARLIAVSGEVMGKLANLVTLLAEVSADEMYQEWYRIFGDDEDALHDLMDAQRAIRSFARIARERAARTEREP